MKSAETIMGNAEKAELTVGVASNEEGEALTCAEDQEHGHKLGLGARLAAGVTVPVFTLLLKPFDLLEKWANLLEHGKWSSKGGGDKGHSGGDKGHGGGH